MTIERELLKEVLEYFDPLGLNTEHCGDLPERIKELLAQPEQDPRDFNFYAHMFESGFMRAGREASARFIKEANKREIKNQIERTEQTEQEPLAINENTSDGYHTFKELYEFRKAYNVALFNEWGATGKCHTHKSWRHNDGELCFGGGWFIVVAVLPQGQISNHYEAKDWDLFSIQEVEKALFEFDGHTGADVVERLKLYTAPPTREPLSDEEIYSIGNKYAFHAAVREIERIHGIGRISSLSMSFQRVSTVLILEMRINSIKILESNQPMTPEQKIKELYVGRVVEYHRPHYPNNILYVHIVRFKDMSGWTLGTGIVVNNLGREHTIALEEIRL